MVLIWLDASTIHTSTWVAASTIFRISGDGDDVDDDNDTGERVTVGIIGIFDRDVSVEELSVIVSKII